MKLFRPHAIPKHVKIRNKGQYNFSNWITCSNFIQKTFGNLHYLGSHSPICKKWSAVEQRFLKRYQRTEL